MGVKSRLWRLGEGECCKLCLVKVDLAPVRPDVCARPVSVQAGGCVVKVEFVNGVCGGCELDGLGSCFGCVCVFGGEGVGPESEG
eukprot:2375373-Rhodomonas_salina.1